VNGSLTVDVTRRLAAIKVLLSRAEEESGLAAPFSADSINRLHDIADMFLALAVQVHNVKLPSNFEGYWDALASPLGRPLGYRTAMQRFNKVRVNLKHYGAEPHAGEIKEGLSAVRGLLEDECSALFGIELGAVSLGDFVSDAKARELLVSAEDFWLRGEPLEAFAHLSEAFQRVVKDYTERKQTGSGRSIFSTGVDFTFLTPFHRRVEDRAQARFEHGVIETINALDRKVLLIGFGIDMRRFGRFEALTPHVAYYADRTRRVYEKYRDAPVRSDVEYAFCRDFVIASAIHFAEFDYELGLPQSRPQQIEAGDGTYSAPDTPLT
jgi:hypothetical protein